MQGGGDDADRAISPVIGIVLMVAITVLLVSAVAAFTLGFGEPGESAPSLAMEKSVDTQEVRFFVRGGDSFRTESGRLRIDVTVANTTSGDTASADFRVDLGDSKSEELTVEDDSGNTETFEVVYDSNIKGDSVDVGESFGIALAGTPPNNHLKIVEYDADVVWESSGSSQRLYSDTFSRPVTSDSGSSPSGPSAPNPTISTITEQIGGGMDEEIVFEVTGGDSFDAKNTDAKITLTVKNLDDSQTETVVERSDDPSGGTAPWYDMRQSIDLTGAGKGFSDSHWGSDEPDLEYFASSADRIYDGGEKFSVRVNEQGKRAKIVSWKVELIHDTGPDETVIWSDSG